MDPITLALTLAGQFAPSLIKHFTNSETAAAVAGQVIDMARTVTGTGTPDEALASLKADPALALQFKLAALQADTELEKASLADRANARGRDVALAQAGRMNWRGDLLAFFAVGGLVLCVYFIARDADMPERAVNAVMFIAGVLASAVRDVYGFEFGSSRSSQVKDATISNLSK
ncbi:Phage protein [Polaromonas sp. CG9_12]|nr:Phage protein [Polaromonas sp. CG9_12]